VPRLVSFQLGNGNCFVAEVDGDSGDGRTMRGISAAPEMIVQSSKTFEASLRNIKQAAEVMVDRLCSLAKPPDELGVEFGVKLNAETGAIIAKASTEANFTITLKWKRTLAEGG
jgi:hypothetical protein